MNFPGTSPLHISPPPPQISAGHSPLEPPSRALHAHGRQGGNAPRYAPISRNLVFGHSKLQTSCGFSGRESSSGFVCAGQCRYPRHIISAESSVGFVLRNESMRSFRNYALGTLTPHRKLGFDRGLDQGVAGGDTDCWWQGGEMMSTTWSAGPKEVFLENCRV